MSQTPAAQWDPILKGLLDHMLKVDASDLYITADSAPVFRINGVGHAGRALLPTERIIDMAQSIMTEAQSLEFNHKLEMNLALANETGGRFRANIFRQRGAVGMVFRLVR